MDKSEYIGWDAGGAHLKMARISADGSLQDVIQLATPLWKDPTQLEQALTEICSACDPGVATHTLTMTAELVDIFEDRSTGVRTVIDTFSNRFKKKLFLYAGRRGMIPAANACQYIADIASANWYATARFAAGYVENGILIDIGSTTTDIIRFASGQILNRGYTDQERLRTNELIYTGIIRTPVMALTDSVPFAGEWQTIAAEQFANCSDIYRITGELNEEDDMTTTTDSRGKSMKDSIRRLARMLGTDIIDNEDLCNWQELARHLSDLQLEKISKGLSCVLSHDPPTRQTVLVGAGCGRFVAKKLAAQSGLEYKDFVELIDARPDHSSVVSRCAPAVAVAYLSRQTAI